MKLWIKTIAAGALFATIVAGFGNQPLVHAQTQGKFNMSYLSLGGSQSYVRQVDQTRGSLQVISPDYFNLTADGFLELSPTMDPVFVEEMHKRGIRVVPFLSNQWDRELGRKALENREVLAEQITGAVAKYKLDGVDVDIENVTEADRDNFTDLVRLLRSKLPADSAVSVAVGANPTSAVTGWPGSYDYKALAGYADYLMLMAYDESYPGDPTPGPVASMPYVEKSIQNLLQKVPPDKVVLGVPFYGRYWNGVAAYNGAGLSNRSVETLIGRYNGHVRFDEHSQSPVATLTIRPTDQPFSIFGKRLPAGDYTIWYENERSIKEKLKLVAKYGLKGTGSWSLNQETVDTWGYYSLWLNGFPFADAQGHWAQRDILFAAERGWMLGVSAERFLPDAALTRAEAAAILVRALRLEGEAHGSFSDVPVSHWARRDIALAKQHGLIQGISDGRFAPDRTLTREEMCMLLTRVLSSSSPPDAAAKMPFPDVPTGSWSYKAIAAMRQQGLVDGFADGTFRPGAPVSRAEMATLLSRVAPQFKQNLS